MDFICGVINMCKLKGIYVVIDICGYVKLENYERVVKCVDLFLYDIKFIDEDKYIKFIGKLNDLILKNVKILSELGVNINIRILLIVGVNVDDENLEVKKMIEFLKFLNI